MEQQLGFTTAPDGVSICYATVGEGPPLVKAPNWLSHLEYDWRSPVRRHWWEELAQNHRLIRCDQGASGCRTGTLRTCLSMLESATWRPWSTPWAWKRLLSWVFLKAERPRPNTR